MTTRTVDVLDRVTAVTYSDGTPGTGYAYDVGAFGKGRLSSITRSGQTISYGYDRFGRLKLSSPDTALANTVRHELKLGDDHG